MAKKHNRKPRAEKENCVPIKPIAKQPKRPVLKEKKQQQWFEKRNSKKLLTQWDNEFELSEHKDYLTDEEEVKAAKLQLRCHFLEAIKAQVL